VQDFEPFESGSGSKGIWPPWRGISRGCEPKGAANGARGHGKMTLSVCMIAHNEEHHIGEALESVRFCSGNYRGRL